MTLRLKRGALTREQSRCRTLTLFSFRFQQACRKGLNKKFLTARRSLTSEATTALSKDGRMVSQISGPTIFEVQREWQTQDVILLQHLQLSHRSYVFRLRTSSLMHNQASAVPVGVEEAEWPMQRLMKTCRRTN